MELSKVTSKGQVVIPLEIREELDLNEGSAVVVSTIGDLVLMRKVVVKDPKVEFEKLTKWGAGFVKKRGIKSEEDVAKRIEKGRGVMRV